MPRYFLELSYKGDNYSGFQIQDNAHSVQEEVEKALAVYFRKEIGLTGSSRTDTGVHALQNYFHFDFEEVINKVSLYNINAILPGDIAVRDIFPVGPEAHCRYDAIGREYRYYVYRRKDPFLADRAYYYPYTLDRGRLAEAAAQILAHADFRAFSKRNTQVNTYSCTIGESSWGEEGGCLVYRVQANRFLRGMVRGLVATMLQVGRGKLSPGQFGDILQSGDNRRADFSVPGHGLFLFRVSFPDSLGAGAG
jgi:tRNA pseudouridine38-40 synthase